MGYTVSSNHVENECYITIQFHYPMSTFYAVLKWSRFQRIGYVLAAYWLARSLAREEDTLIVEGETTVIEALEEYGAGLTAGQISELLSLDTFDAQFEYTWSLLMPKEQKEELEADSSHWDNFWPRPHRLDHFQQSEPC